MLRQPARDDPMHVDGAIVQDGVDVRPVGRILVEPVEERGDLRFRRFSARRPMTLPSKMFWPTNGCKNAEPKGAFHDSWSGNFCNLRNTEPKRRERAEPT